MLTDTVTRRFMIAFLLTRSKVEITNRITHLGDDVSVFQTIRLFRVNGNSATTDTRIILKLGFRRCLSLINTYYSQIVFYLNSLHDAILIY